VLLFGLLWSPIQNSNGTVLKYTKYFCIWLYPNFVQETELLQEMNEHPDKLEASGKTEKLSSIFYGRKLFN
jgi:hypothetical protein